MLLYDTTLRDGAQMVGMSLSGALGAHGPGRRLNCAIVSPAGEIFDNGGSIFPLTGDDKVNISRHLINLGVSYIEGGWPGASLRRRASFFRRNSISPRRCNRFSFVLPTPHLFAGSNLKDAEFFRRFARDLGPSAAAAGTRLAAFGSTRRRNTTCDADPQVQALLDCAAPCVTLVAKTWGEQVERVIGTTKEENLRMITDTVRFFKSHGREVALDAEHFFDGAAADRQYALDCLKAGAEAGADFLVLCDTNGAAMPWDIEQMVREVRERTRKHVDLC